MGVCPPPQPQSSVTPRGWRYQLIIPTPRGEFDRVFSPGNSSAKDTVQSARSSTARRGNGQANGSGA